MWDVNRRNAMDNNENKKAPEELADEALDAVTGGKRTLQVRPVPPPLPVPDPETTDGLPYE